MSTHDAEKALDSTSHYEDTPARPGPRFADGESLAGYTTTTSEKAGSSKYASSETGLEHVKASKAAERKLVRKLDAVILPMAVLLYLSAYLDRGAMGNAKLMGLEQTVLGNVDVRYSIALMCFYITYIVLSIPGTLFAKQFLPSTTIACGALVWSIATTCQAATHNPASLYVCRLFIGVGEAFLCVVRLSCSRSPVAHILRPCSGQGALLRLSCSHSPVSHTLQAQQWLSTSPSGTRSRSWRSALVSSSRLARSPAPSRG